MVSLHAEDAELLRGAAQYAAPRTAAPLLGRALDVRGRHGGVPKRPITSCASPLRRDQLVNHRPGASCRLFWLSGKNDANDAAAIRAAARAAADASRHYQERRAAGAPRSGSRAPGSAGGSARRRCSCSRGLLPTPVASMRTGAAAGACRARGRSPMKRCWCFCASARARSPPTCAKRSTRLSPTGDREIARRTRKLMRVHSGRTLIERDRPADVKRAGCDGRRRAESLRRRKTPARCLARPGRRARTRSAAGSRPGSAPRGAANAVILAPLARAGGAHGAGSGAARRASAGETRTSCWTATTDAAASAIRRRSS